MCYCSHEIHNSRRLKKNKMYMPTVDQYLVADCLFIIDEFNILYRGYKQDELKKEAATAASFFYPSMSRSTAER